MRHRPSARIFVVNEKDEVLLFRFENTKGALKGKTFWATPGGAVESNETFSEAAIRELSEETGIRVDSLEAPVWEQEVTFQLPNGEYVIAEEQFFLLAWDKEVSNKGLTALEKELITEHRWWSVAQLRITDELYFPENLLTILEGLKQQKPSETGEHERRCLAAAPA